MDEVMSNATSQDQTGDASIIAGERLYNQGLENMKSRVQRHAQEKAQRELGEAVGCNFQPKILRPNEKHDMDQFVKRMAMWSDKQAKKHKEEIKKEDAKKAEDYPAKPILDPMSKKLVAFKQKRKQYAGPVRGWKRNFTNYMVTKGLGDVHGPKGLPHPDPQYTFKPSINAASRTMHFPTPVTERLYKDTHHREAQMDLIRTWDQVRQGYDVATGQPLFRPTTNSASYNNSAASQQRSRTPSGMSSSDNIVSSLLERGEDYRERRRQMAEDKYKGMTFAPKTNTKSKQIVRDIITRGPTPARVKKTDPSPSPQPPWNRTRSKSAEPAKFNVSTFCTRVSHDRDYHNAKMAVLREEKAEAAESECTFQPRISHNSQVLFRRSHGGGGGQETSPPMYRSHVVPSAAASNSKPRHDDSPWIAPAGTAGRPEDFTPTPIPARRVAESTGPASAGDKSDFLRSLENELRSTVEDWKKK